MFEHPNVFRLRAAALVLVAAAMFTASANAYPVSDKEGLNGPAAVETTGPAAEQAPLVLPDKAADVGTRGILADGQRWPDAASFYTPEALRALGDRGQAMSDTYAARPSIPYETYTPIHEVGFYETSAAVESAAASSDSDNTRLALFAGFVLMMTALAAVVIRQSRSRRFATS